MFITKAISISLIFEICGVLVHLSSKVSGYVNIVYFSNSKELRPEMNSKRRG